MSGSGRPRRTDSCRIPVSGLRRLRSTSTARAFRGETYRTRQRFLGSAGGGVEASRSRAARNAARVLPEPVGATTSTSDPSPIARQAPSCAVVGVRKAPVNHERVAGENESSAAPAMPPSCTRPLTTGRTWGNVRRRGGAEWGDGDGRGAPGVGQTLAVPATARAGSAARPLRTPHLPAPRTRRVRDRGRHRRSRGDRAAGPRRAGRAGQRGPDQPRSAAHRPRRSARRLGLRHPLPLARPDRRGRRRDRHSARHPGLHRRHGRRPAGRPGDH